MSFPAWFRLWQLTTNHAAKLLFWIVTTVVAVFFFFALDAIYGRRFRAWIARHLPWSKVEADFLAVFEGKVEQLTDGLLATPAEATRIRQFYSGAPLSWSIIAAEADIERDQAADLLERAATPATHTRLICVLGEAGAGKSTLTWRIAAELRERHNCCVLRIIDNQDAEVWYRLRIFYELHKKPFYVLVDDVFREGSVVDALYQLTPDIPMTILATSRLNEYKERRTNLEVHALRLRPPSPEEKGRVLQRFNRRVAEMTPQQVGRLDSANQFLVLMLELTSGKDLEESVRDTIEKLGQTDQVTYIAYEYICFAYQYGISVPVDVLERAKNDNRFYKLTERVAAQGIILPDEIHSAIRAGHPVLAKIASKNYEHRRDSRAVFLELVRAVDSAELADRKFFAHLLRCLCKHRRPLLEATRSEIQPTVLGCIKKASRISEIVLWANVTELLGNKPASRDVLRLVFSIPPVTHEDCRILAREAKAEHRDQEAIPAVETWLDGHPDDSVLRAEYTKWVRDRGTPEQFGLILLNTSRWILRHPQDSNMRCAYLALVEDKRTPEHILSQALLSTEQWLSQHPEDSRLRTVFLGSVERGSPEQVQQFLLSTEQWLSEHLVDTNVRANYLGLVERRGTPEQCKRALLGTSRWLSEHSQHANVWASYLRFAEKKGSPEDLQQALQPAERWLSEHPDDTNVRANYVRAIRKRMSKELQERTAEVLAEWTREHWDECVQHQYAHLLLTLRRNSDAVDQFQRIINKNEKNSAALCGLATALRYLALEARHENEERSKYLFSRAENQFRKALQYSPRDPRSHAGLGWLLLDLGNFTEARDRFLTAIRYRPDVSKNQCGLGKAQKGLREFKKAAQAFHRALELASQDLPSSAREEISGLQKECESFAFVGRREGLKPAA